MTKRLLTIALAVVLTALVMMTAAMADGEWIMYVYTDNGKTLNVRSEPLVGNNIIGQAKYGQAIDVRMTSANGWATINWGNGIAYVQSRFLVPYKPTPRPAPAPTPAPGPDSGDAAKTISNMNAEFRSAVRVSPYTVIARPSRASGWVNLRWAPTTEAERIATCAQGKELTVLAELRNWYQVQDPVTGMIGFISRNYVNRK